MRIAQIATLFESVPPQAYGGTERVVSWLTEELVRQGHDVTLFASGDSVTSARLISPCAKSLRTDPNVLVPLAPHFIMLEQVLRRANQFDVMHFHIDFLHFSICRRIAQPTATTLHGRLDLPELLPLYSEFNDMAAISISDAQREPLPMANWRETVYHGLPLDLHNFREQPAPYLLERAIDWIDKYGDVDGDGFVEYARQSSTGLVQQGWKDSHDSVFHEDGSPAQGPIALCEVQAYAYGAWKAAAKLAAALGHAELTRVYDERARRLQERFEEAYWCEELSTYALALDGQKRPCRVRSSNAGQCLFTGIARSDRARRLAQTLVSPGFFSGWGIRTIASTEARYNPMSYHNGSIWPHDNALIALGLARYGS